MKASRNGVGSISAGPVGSSAKSENGNGIAAAAENKKATSGDEVNGLVHVCGFRIQERLVTLSYVIPLAGNGFAQDPH